MYNIYNTGGCQGSHACFPEFDTLLELCQLKRLVCKVKERAFDVRWVVAALVLDVRHSTLLSLNFSFEDR